MSVDRIDYVMWGVDVGYDNVEYDDFLDEIEGDPDAPFRIIYDGMNEDYAIAGVIIAKSDEYDGFDMTDITKEVSSSERFLETTHKIKERFPHVDILDFGIKVFSHFY